MSNYESLLKQSWADVPQPKLLPTGSWELRCTGAKLAMPKQEDQKPQVLFTMVPVEPMEDVNDAALQELGTEDYSSVTEPIYYKPFYESATDKQKVRVMLKRLGVANVDELNLEQSLKAAVNGSCIGYITTEHYTAKSGEAVTKNAIAHFVQETK